MVRIQSGEIAILLTLVMALASQLERYKCCSIVSSNMDRNAAVDEKSMTVGGTGTTSEFAARSTESEIAPRMKVSSDKTPAKMGRVMKKDEKFTGNDE